MSLFLCELYTLLLVVFSVLMYKLLALDVTEFLLLLSLGTFKGFYDSISSLVCLSWQAHTVSLRPPDYKAVDPALARFPRSWGVTRCNKVRIGL